MNAALFLGKNSTKKDLSPAGKRSRISIKTGKKTNPPVRLRVAQLLPYVPLYRQLLPASLLQTW